MEDVVRSINTHCDKFHKGYYNSYDDVVNNKNKIVVLLKVIMMVVIKGEVENTTRSGTYYSRGYVVDSSESSDNENNEDKIEDVVVDSGTYVISVHTVTHPIVDPYQVLDD